MSSKNCNELTLEDIERALKDINKYDSCKVCKTTKMYMVLGYGGLYCKCKADELSNTKRAKDAQNFIKRVFKVNGE